MFYVSNTKTSMLGVYVISNKTKYVVFTVCSKQAITRQVCYSKCKCKQQQDTYSYITSMFGVYESSYKKTFAMSATDIINIIFSSKYSIMVLQERYTREWYRWYRSNQSNYTPDRIL